MTHIGIFHDGITGVTTKRALTDDEVVTTFLPQLVLTASHPQIALSGTLTLCAQLTSVPLSDGTRRPIPSAQRIQVAVDETIVDLETDEHGYAEKEFTFAASGDYEFAPYGISGIAAIVSVI